MSPRPFLIPLLLSSAACSPAAPDAPTAPAATARAGTVANARATAAPGLPVDYMDKETKGPWMREFAYRWPAGLSRQPGLVALLTADRTELLAAQKAEYAAAVADSPADCPGCGSRSYRMEWKQVTETPRFLSLSGDFSTYEGGAHGNYGLRSLVWDKAAKLPMDGIALFGSPAALQTALGAKLCRALDAERAKRRGGQGGGDGIFDDCPPLTDATLLVGSSDKQKLDRITVWFGPYVAGAYAEGAYELDFPVDEAVLAAVRPEYAGAFAVQR